LSRFSKILAQLISSFYDFPKPRSKRLFDALSVGMSASGQGTDADKNIEIWKVKKLIKRLEAAYVVLIIVPLCVI
jgi:hypothetical protein